LDVLIIGSGGYIGAKLAIFHKSLGDNVICVSSRAGDINPLTGDFNPSFSIPLGVSTVYYLAQSPFYRSLPKYANHLLQVNTLLAIKTAEMCRQAKVRNFFYASTGNVYSHSFDKLTEHCQLNRNNWYSLSKIMAEEALNLFRDDFNVIVARIFSVYGPGQTDKLIPLLINRVKENRTILIENALNDDNEEYTGMKFSLIYIDDLIHCVAKITTMESPPKIVNISGKEILSIKDIANIISKKLNKKLKFEINMKKRECNLIADTSYLNSLFQHDFKDFNSGIEITLKGEKKINDV
jgi:UDP-glucose 4-epimerase